MTRFYKTLFREISWCYFILMKAGSTHEEKYNNAFAILVYATVAIMPPVLIITAIQYILS